MRPIYILFTLVLFVLSSCKKETFFDKFVPEILYYKDNKVENANFKSTTLDAGTSSWTVKARVSAPFNLKEVKLYQIKSGKNEELLQTYSDFRLSPTVFSLTYLVENISADVVIKITAIDVDNRTTTRDFTIVTSP